jgi:hypothetical protein
MYADLKSGVLGRRDLIHRSIEENNAFTFAKKYRNIEQLTIQRNASGDADGKLWHVAKTPWFLVQKCFPIAGKPI